MPKFNFWGIPTSHFDWTYEDGRKFDPAEIYPVVDPASNRIFGIMKEDESDVVVVQSYHQSAQLGAALNFAEMVWGEPRDWERPDKSTSVVSCLGSSAACLGCSGEEVTPTIAPALDWRIEPFSTGPEMYAQVLLSAGDPVNERLSERHIIADVSELAIGQGDIQKELTRCALALFGPLVDIDSQLPEPPAILQYDVVLRPSTPPHIKAHFHRPQQDIYTPLTRLFGE